MIQTYYCWRYVIYCNNYQKNILISNEYYLAVSGKIANEIEDIVENDRKKAMNNIIQRNRLGQISFAKTDILNLVKTGESKIIANFIDTTTGIPIKIAEDIPVKIKRIKYFHEYIYSFFEVAMGQNISETLFPAAYGAFFLGYGAGTWATDTTFSWIVSTLTVTITTWGLIKLKRSEHSEVEKVS